MTNFRRVRGREGGREGRRGGESSELCIPEEMTAKRKSRKTILKILFPKRREGREGGREGGRETCTQKHTNSQ